MSTMEQALRDEIAEHKRCIASYERDKTYIQSSAIRWHRARLAALTAALPAPKDMEFVLKTATDKPLAAVLPNQVPAPGVEAPGDWVMVPRVATDAMTEAAKEYLDATDLEIGMAYDLMLSAAPSAPAEISQAQAQAMREALEGAIIDLRNTRTNIMVDLAKGNDRWEGVPDRLKDRIDGYEAALTPEPPR